MIAVAILDKIVKLVNVAGSPPNFSVMTAAAVAVGANIQAIAPSATNTLKGAIINKLKRNYCREKTFKCRSCNLDYLCPIQSLFNEKNIQEKGNPSNPIIINTFLRQNTKSNEFYINIKLIEHGIFYREALEDILRQGIDIKNKDDNIKFKLHTIGYKDSAGNLNLEPIINEYKNGDIKCTDTLAITIDSPLRLQDSAKSLEFNQLLRVMMTRIDSVGVLTTASKSYSKKIIEDAKHDIILVHKDIETVLLIRQSKHNNKRFEEQCITGKIIYKGNFEKYIDIIKNPNY